MRMLIVDDEMTNCVVMKRMAMKVFGGEIDIETSGFGAVKACHEKRYDIIVTDYMMPELNGLDMLLELTREFLRAKVIAISGAGEEKNVLDVAKLLGARQTFQKPFSVSKLLGAVRYDL